ncbi:hypothetical protein AWB77_04800 [Caballeronia fortuita]|uniref:Uncharacterized protein n=1 Tax=Caballeronia fortuita TaxID=1777138 RepID=A0A158D2X3_9BURK|nr:hypothetical protein [Caballeronia fortuita]SAK88586.1 hypothetical protein AWB77_04800 [Caballeronia fortuita]
MTPTELLTAGQLLFSVILAGITVWYASETARLRRISERQVAAMEASINLTKASFDSTLLPYLILGILPLEQATLGKLDAQPPTSYIDLPGLSAGVLVRDKRLVFSVINATEKLASHIFMIYVDMNHMIYISCMVAESIGPKEELLLPMTRESVPLAEVKRMITEMYEGRGGYLLEQSTLSDGTRTSIIDQYARAGGHLLTIFFDLAGKLYAIPRVVTETVDDEGKIILRFGKSDLIQDKTTWFAPTFDTAVGRPQV